MCDYQDYVHKAMEQNAMSFDEADDLWVRDIDNLEIAKDHKGKNGTLRLAWKIEESCANHGAKRPANPYTNFGGFIDETNLNTSVWIHEVFMSCSPERYVCENQNMDPDIHCTFCKQGCDRLKDRQTIWT